MTGSRCGRRSAAARSSRAAALSSSTQEFAGARYWTLAVTDASPEVVNVQVFTFLPPLEQAPTELVSVKLGGSSVQT